MASLPRRVRLVLAWVPRMATLSGGVRVAATVPHAHHPFSGKKIDTDPQGNPRLTR